MNVTKIRQLLEWIDEATAAIEAELEVGQLTSELKKKTKSPPKLKGAIGEFSAHQDVLKSVTHEIQVAWLKTYGDKTWIWLEIDKCKLWCLAKGVHTKNWGLRINNWLMNAAKSKPSTETKKVLNPLLLGD